MRAVFFLTLWLFFCGTAGAQTVSGYIFSDQGEPLPGANIYIDGSSIGTITNNEGFYILKAPAGPQTIVFSFIGFINDTVTINLARGQTVRKNIRLREHTLQGDAIMVFAEEYNDAQQIVRKTIENKNKYLAAIKNYTYEAYQKTVFEVDRSSRGRFMGGLIESKSRGYYQYPDRFQEVVLAKRQSKNFSSLTNVFTVGKIPNLLEETIQFDELTVISPLSRRALDYYYFEMIDTTWFNQSMVFNMALSPKNETLPLFRGTISIIDREFAVVSLELHGDNRIVTTIRDSIYLKETFREFQQKFWFPTLMQMTCRIKFDLPGLPWLYWQQVGLLSNYSINNSAFHHEFDQNTLIYDLLPEVQAAQIWDSEQVIPLNGRERKDLAHIDSVVTNANFLKKSALWFLQNFDKFLITGFYDFYHVNRVQGQYLGIGVDTRRALEAGRYFLRAGYGLSDKRFNYDLGGRHLLAGERLALRLRLYDRLNFADRWYRYNPTDITSQVYWAGKDYADYIYQRGALLGLEFKPVHHLRVSLDLEQSRHNRAGIQKTDWPLDRSPALRGAFPVQEGLFRTVGFGLVLDNLKYFDYGWLSAPDMAQDFYDIQLRLLVSSQQYLASARSFRLWYAFINLYKKFPPYFHFYIRLNGGQLDGDKPLQYWFHLAGAYGSFGNPILFRTITSDRFLGDRFWAISLENNFKNTIFGLLHLPYFKNSKLDLLLFTNLGWIRNSGFRNGDFNRMIIDGKPLTEAGVSIGNIFSFLRLDFTWRLNYKTGQDFNIRLTSRLFVR